MLLGLKTAHSSASTTDKLVGHTLLRNQPPIPGGTFGASSSADIARPNWVEVERNDSLGEVVVHVVLDKQGVARDNRGSIS